MVRYSGVLVMVTALGSSVPLFAQSLTTPGTSKPIERQVAAAVREPFPKDSKIG